jgi:hypothetical protein
MGNGLASRARCPKASARSDSARRATAGWRRCICRLWRRLWRSMSTVLPRGLNTGHWHQRASHASWRWRPNTFANGIRPSMGQSAGVEGLTNEGGDVVLGCRRGRQREQHRNLDVHLGSSRLIARRKHRPALGADQALDQLRAKPPPARRLGWRPAVLAPGQR